MENNQPVCCVYCSTQLTDLLQGQNLVAADVVELAPGLDASGCSSVLAAKVVRSLLLSLAAH